MEGLTSMGPTPPQIPDRHGPTPPRRTVVIAVVATVVVALLAVVTLVILNRQSSDGQVAAPPVAVAPQPPLYVSPEGRDSNDIFVKGSYFVSTPRFGSAYHSRLISIRRPSR